MKFSKFFSKIQETPWYQDFLNPVIDKIDNNSSLLDIGTGTGKLIQTLAKKKNVSCVGVDTDENMLNEAKLKVTDKNIQLMKIDANKKLPFANASYDYITICSVLFLLDKKSIDLILVDAKRLLKNNGKILVLTPTGNKNALTLTRKYFSLKNVGLHVWYKATKKKGKLWNKNKYLKEYANKNNLAYHSDLVMNEFAQLEILQ